MWIWGNNRNCIENNITQIINIWRLFYFFLFPRVFFGGGGFGGQYLYVCHLDPAQSRGAWPLNDFLSVSDCSWFAYKVVTWKCCLWLFCWAPWLLLTARICVPFFWLSYNMPRLLSHLPFDNSTPIGYDTDAWVPGGSPYCTLDWCFIPAFVSRSPCPMASSQSNAHPVKQTSLSDHELWPLLQESSMERLWFESSSQHILCDILRG